jgi:hypothetical protein
MRVRTLAAAGGALLAVAAVPAAAPAHLHPFNAAAACAPAATGAGNEAAAFFSAPGVQEHWEIVDLSPAPGTQFLIQLSNPGRADESSGAIAPPGIFVGNPGSATAAGNCAQPKP